MTKLSVLLLSIPMFCGSLWAASNDPRPVDLKPLTQKVKLSNGAFAELCTVYPGHYNCVTATDELLTNYEINSRFVKLDLAFSNTIKSVVDDLLSDPDTFEAKVSFLKNQSFVGQIALKAISATGDDGLDEVPNRRDEALQNILSISGGVGAYKIASRIFNFSPAGIAAFYGTSSVVDESFKNYRLRQIESRLATLDPQALTPVLNELFYVFASENYLARDTFNFYRAFNEFGQLSALGKNHAQLQLFRSLFKDYFIPEKHPELTGAVYLQSGLCKGVVLRPQDTKELLLIRGSSWGFLDKLKTQLREYSDGIIEYQKYLNSLKPKYPDLSKAIDGRLAETAQWQRQIETLNRELQLPNMLQEFTHPAPNNFALEKVMAALRQIIAFEAKSSLAQFNTLYRCP